MAVSGLGTSQVVAVRAAAFVSSSADGTAWSRTEVAPLVVGTVARTLCRSGLAVPPGVSRLCPFDPVPREVPLYDTTFSPST